MTENATDQHAELAELDHEIEQFTAPSTRGLQRLRAEVEAMKDAATLARGIAASGFIPDHWIKEKLSNGGYREKPFEEAVAGMATAILFGVELGLSAMRSVNELFVIHGKPAMYARTAAALIRAAGYVIEPVEESDTLVIWRGYRDGKWKYSEWTIQRATTAEYTKNKLYTTNPMEMLRSKAIMEVARIAFQDVLLGMNYSVEELDLIEGVSVQRPVRKGSRGAQALRELADAADAPPAAGQNTPDEPPKIGEVIYAQTPAQAEAPDPNGPATAEQIKAIEKMYRSRKLTGQAMLDDIAQFLCRQQPLSTFADLTYGDAAAVLEGPAETPE